MSSLLSPFNFGQKHAYFHARITIHELANVPLIDGNFKTRWRVKNGHNLQSLPASQGEDTATAGSEEGGGGERRSLQHKKSFASSIASQEISSLTTKDSPKSDHHPTDDKGNTTRERKTSHRFLSGFKDVLNSKARRPSSSSEARPRESSDDRPLSDNGGGGAGGGKMGKHHSTAMQRDATRNSTHSKAESYDSLGLHRPRRTASFNDSGSVKMTSLSARAEDRDSHFHLSSLHQMEPRGETTNERIKEHHVKWERTFDVGVRIPVVKNRLAEKVNSNNNNNSPNATASGALSPSSGPGHSGTNSSEAGGSGTSASGTRMSMSSSMSDQRNRTMADSRASEGESRADKLDKEIKEKEKDREMVDVWGMLGNTELKLTVKADISTERVHHKDPESHVTMGYVTINLAELAPYPESSAHQHHNHLHHHHHHHHHHSPTLYRAEARRYLLIDSRNNATLKVTVEMTHVGGTKEFAVPAARKGLLVAGAASLMNDLKKGDGSSNSEASHSTEGNFNEVSRPGLGDHRSSGLPNDSITSFKQDHISAWPTNSVARHGRIPSSNLKTELSHQEAARAVKEAGGQRMGFSFGAGAHHERPPEDVIDALFKPGPSKVLSQMLTPYGSRSESPKKTPSIPSRKKLERKGDMNGDPQGQQTDGNQSERGIYPEKPPHFDGVSPAEHPKDSARSRGESLSRFTLGPGAEDVQPGPDIGQSSPLPNQSSAEPSTDIQSDENSKKPTQHRRNSSNGTVKSILTNSLTPKNPSVKGGGTAMTHSNSSGATSYDHAAASSNVDKPSQTSNTSTRVNLVHWDADIDHGKEEAPPSSVPLVPSPLSTGGLTVAAPNLTASPRAMSRDISEDSLFPTKPNKAPSLQRTPSTMHEEEESDSDKHYSLAPPSTPPDVSQKEKAFALDSRSVKSGIQKAQQSRPASKGTKGLTKEEALKQGYRGAGWGTMSWLWQSPMNEAPDYPLDVYTEAPSSHLNLDRDTVQ